MTAHEDPAFWRRCLSQANEVRAGFDAIQYLRSSQLVIDSITLKSPQIDLVKTRDGVLELDNTGETDFGGINSLEPWYLRVSLIHRFFRSRREDALSTSTLRKINIESGAVRLTDYAGSEPSSVSLQSISA